MLFNSYSFLVGYLPVVLFGFFLTARWSHRAAAGWLALASVAFYAGWSAPYVALLLGSILFNFLIGRRLALCPGRKLLTLGIACDLALLGYYKYLDFGIASVNGFFGTDFGLVHVVLPLGISFFTFTQIAFLVDAASGKAKEYDFVHYLLFVTYFPHLIAGPILHHREMMPQFARAAVYRFSSRSMAIGIGFFVIGLVKKVVLADTVAPVADSIFERSIHVPLTLWEAWIGALAYTFQIYFDFSGYSDMAIGLARMTGIRLPLNFASPYKATSISDFWRRWHMTLSRFLRDYLYFSLGGNRHGATRRYANLAVTMILGGLWHGAAWTFVLWGALHGAYLIVNHAWRAWMPPLPKLLGGVLTFAAVVVAWVLFRAHDMDMAWAMLAPMMGGNGLALPGFLASYWPEPPSWVRLDGTFANGLVTASQVVPHLIGLAALVWLLPNTQQCLGRLRRGQWLARFRWRPTLGWGVVMGFAMAVSLTLMGGDSPFLYFRF